ncbi:hypothetical protein scyTo_0007018 [Scyliorhinus torazame]|uniref:Uncharacterized protein n=1 Tax=Scyliorhinus torazame TaxID=75743 RepID=A0A401NK66_SCYTO|nr:hypothetical protein [Scyliorhinus torazame]
MRTSKTRDHFCRVRKLKGEADHQFTVCISVRRHCRQHVRSKSDSRNESELVKRNELYGRQHVKYSE